MLLVLLLFSISIKSNIDSNFDTIKECINSLCKDNAISDQEKSKQIQKIDEIQSVINHAEHKIKTKKNGYDVYIENILGYIPVIQHDNNMTRKEFNSKRNSAIKYLAQGNFNKAYKQFQYLSKNQNFDPCIHYYWMGVIALKQKEFLKSILHFGQFYKSMHKNKGTPIYNENLDKMPRSILNIVECLFHLKQKDKSALMLDFFHSKYKNHRKSMHEKYISQQVQQSQY
ncbi:tetratricopeptide repeat protein [Candidatus Cytomitobacter primus]|uniref:Tetratricopeptide repeat protein n=1 Tax=Candidatus Cytomitobacter primus TaxID=2066024 RepID=A0A5C0UFH0_9PROT|nr:hypothetical protein [Candidatus Cytomitobacter primus]QEK38529.1 hypothetical protein FZC34_01230 [Candidatus Cytomitobacter primus]